MKRFALVFSATGCVAAASGPAPVVADVANDLGEASGVAKASIGGAPGFVVIDDEAGVRFVEPGRPARVLVAATSPDLKDLEGVCVVGGDIVVVAEGSGVVSRIPIAGGAAVRVGVLPHPPSPKTKKNKGWEGLAFLPASLADDKVEHLVAVHEGLPKAVSLFAWPSLAPQHTLALPPELDRLLDDLSDVAVDPRTGEILLLSDESQRLVWVRLSLAGAAPSLTLVRQQEVPVGKDEKPEGVTVDDAGVVWIVTDGSHRLFALPPLKNAAAPANP